MSEEMENLRSDLKAVVFTYGSSSNLVLWAKIQDAFGLHEKAVTQLQTKLDAAVKALEEVSKIETTRLGRLAELFDLGDTSQEVKDNTERLRAGDSAISRLITKTLKEIE